MEGRCGLPAVAVALLAGVAGCGGGLTIGAEAETLYLIAYGGPSGSVTAQVQVYDPKAPQVKCASPVSTGACQLFSCDVSAVITPAPGYGDLGPVAATVDTTTESLTYAGSGYPTVGFPAPIALGTGGIMKFSGGDGVSVPTFAVSATVPDVGVITEPVNAEGGGSAIVDTSKDLAVTWMPISVGQIQFRIVGGAPGTDVNLQIVCAFDGGAGAGTVPKRLLSLLKGMAGDSYLFGNLTAELETITMVDGLAIVTQGYQSSPTVDSNFEVFLQ